VTPIDRPMAPPDAEASAARRATRTIVVLVFGNRDDVD